MHAVAAEPDASPEEHSVQAEAPGEELYVSTAHFMQVLECVAPTAVE